MGVLAVNLNTVDSIEIILILNIIFITITKFKDLIRDSLRRGAKLWMHLFIIGQLKTTGCVNLCQ